MSLKGLVNIGSKKTSKIWTRGRKLWLVFITQDCIAAAYDLQFALQQNDIKDSIIAIMAESNELSADILGNDSDWFFYTKDSTLMQEFKVLSTPWYVFLDNHKQAYSDSKLPSLPLKSQIKNRRNESRSVSKKDTQDKSNGHLRFPSIGHNQNKKDHGSKTIIAKLPIINNSKTPQHPIPDNKRNVSKEKKVINIIEVSGSKEKDTGLKHKVRNRIRSLESLKKDSHENSPDKINSESRVVTINKGKNNAAFNRNEAKGKTGPVDKSNRKNENIARKDDSSSDEIRVKRPKLGEETSTIKDKSSTRRNKSEAQFQTKKDYSYQRSYSKRRSSSKTSFKNESNIESDKKDSENSEKSKMNKIALKRQKYIETKTEQWQKQVKVCQEEIKTLKEIVSSQGEIIKNLQSSFENRQSGNVSSMRVNPAHSINKFTSLIDRNKHNDYKPKKDISLLYRSKLDRNSFLRNQYRSRSKIEDIYHQKMHII